VSDVIGDDLSVVASGPLTPDATMYADAMRVLERRGIGRNDAPAVWRHLERGTRGEIAETPKRAFDRVAQRIIGSNTSAVRAAIAAVERIGFEVIESREGVTGEAAERGRALAERAAELSAKGVGAVAIVWGGETTVTVGERGGIGGRNQEFALAAAERLAEMDAGARIAVMSFGTDGVDGPTDAAGAVVTGATWNVMSRMGLDPARALVEHDSHSVLKAGGVLIRTGPTGTNVNDVMIAMVYRNGDARQEVQR
jgi:glycerate 2-kinase